MVQHHADLACMWFGGCQELTKRCACTFRPLMMDVCKPSSRAWLNRRTQRARTKLFICIVLCAQLTRAHRSRKDSLTDQEAGSLVKTHNWICWIIRQGIQRQNLLKPCQKCRVDGAQAPGLLQMWLDLVFFRTSATKVCERWAQKPASTTFSASRRNDQRAWPSGASEQARAVILARCVPSISIGRPERGASSRQAKPVVLSPSRQEAT